MYIYDRREKENKTRGLRRKRVGYGYIEVEVEK
jgi:hypothetical protein